MGRRTISNMSREMKVSRQTIYKHLGKLGIERQQEYNLPDWERIKKSISGTSEANKQKRQDAKFLQSDVEPAVGLDGFNKQSSEPISDDIGSTLRARLANAKKDYDCNQRMIDSFQRETDEYYERAGRLTMMNHNGILSAIPSVVNLEKYVKLNITLSRLITDIESDLDLSAGGGDDPFE